MTDQDTRKREGLSFDTLLIAAISSAVAAIVVSQFWQGGTPIAAAVTPVVVSLVSEGLRRPMQSERVRSSARRAVQIGSTQRLRPEPPRERVPGRPEPERSGPPEPTRPAEPAEPQRPRSDEPEYRVYRGAGPAQGGGWRERLSGKRVRIALVTGVLAFVAATLVLTLPELIFGGSVSGTDRNTTLFGGGGDDNGKDERDEERDGGDGQQTPSPGNEPDSDPAPDEDEDPSEEPPSEEPPPTETTPAPGAPVPQPPPETQPSTP